MKLMQFMSGQGRIEAMDQKIEAFLQQPPELVVHWRDSETGAEGWTVINSLRNGAAGGGTRCSPTVSQEELTHLAKVMEIKFTISGPAIGGAKSGVRFNPESPQKRGVLKKFWTRIAPLLKTCYGTGGDLHVNESEEVIPILEELGIWHPQEGIVRGHVGGSWREQARILHQLRQGIGLPVQDPEFRLPGGQPYRVDDLITGFGVAEAVRHFYALWLGESLEGKRVLVQGFGNVGGAAAYYLARAGARIVGILDLHKGLINEAGYDAEGIAMLLRHQRNRLIQDPSAIPRQEAEQFFWRLPADIFIPAAASYLVTEEQIRQLIHRGLTVIASGANIPFREDRPLMGRVTRAVDSQVALIPDFLANCGIARVYALLMEADRSLTDREIFEDVSETIRHALVRVRQECRTPRHLARTACIQAIEMLGG